MNRSDIRAQFGWYLIVGGSAFVVDIGSFLALQAVGLQLLAASALAFVAATAFNYVLSYRLAFSRGKYGRGEEIGRLAFVALVGLGLNTALVWLFVDIGGVLPVIAKVVAVPIVLVWNFLGRRLLVFRPELPSATFTLTQNVVDQIAGPHDGGAEDTAPEKPRP